MQQAYREQELLTAMAGGDQQALRMLWQKWSGKVQMFARLQLAPCGAEAVQLAQEVTSDVFHELWRYPLRYDGRVAFSTWIFTLVRNKAIDCLRKRLRQANYEQSTDDEVLAQLHDPAHGPEAQLVVGQDRRAVLQCLQRLRNPLQREALLLWALEDMPLADIAQAQQCPENTVKTRLFHGRKNLRSCLLQSLGMEKSVND